MTPDEAAHVDRMLAHTREQRDEARAERGAMELRTEAAERESAELRSEVCLLQDEVARLQSKRVTGRCRECRRRCSWDPTPGGKGRCRFLRRKCSQCWKLGQSLERVRPW